MGRKGLQKDTSPSFHLLRHFFPVPCPLHLNFLHINHLCHFEISQSSYYSSIVNDTIDQGINYASRDKKSREQSWPESRTWPARCRQPTRQQREFFKIHEALLASYSPRLPCWLAPSWPSASHTKPLQMCRSRLHDQHSAVCSCG